MDYQSDRKLSVYFNSSNIFDRKNFIQKYFLTERKLSRDFVATFLKNNMKRKYFLLQDQILSAAGKSFLISWVDKLIEKRFLLLSYTFI